MLEFNLLGEQRLAVRGASGSGAAASRSVELLAYLALHAGAAIPRQFLAGLLWPDSPGGQSLTNLRRELHSLRRLVGGVECLSSASGTLGWRDAPDCRADVRIFELEREAALAARQAGDRQGFLRHAQLAIDAYRGELMPGSYADWVVELRGVLKQECVQLCDRVVTAWRDADDLQQAAALAKHRIQLEPLEESGYRRLMELQAGMGESAAAMHTYHWCVSVLEEELGVAPDDATVQMFERLRGPASAGVDLHPMTVRPDGSGQSRRTGLVGRSPQLRILTERWRAALDGQPGMVVVSGAPGVGKTKLAEELALFARSTGAVVAQARCFSVPGRIPLAPVADWLRSRQLLPALASLPPIWRTEVARLLPDLTPAGSTARRRPPSVSRAMVDAWQRQRFFEGLAHAVTSTGRPVLLVLDDAQWCDVETLSWLSYLLRFARGSRLLLAATLRSAEAGREPEAQPLLHTMGAAAMLTEVALEPLTQDATAALAAALEGTEPSPSEAALLQAATGGFPLYIVEAARMARSPASAGAQAGAGRLGTVLWQRLAQASANAREVAGLAAAYGQDISLDLLAEASDLDSTALADAVDELWRLRILRPRGSGYGFSHELLRAAAYEHVTPAHRWLLHRRLAQGLELLYAENVDDVAAQLASQYSQGSRPDRALYFYQRAAETAAGIFANAEALEFFGKCLDLVAELPAGRNRSERELVIRRSMSPAQTALYGYSSSRLQQTLERTAALAQELRRPKDLLASLIGLFAVRIVQGETALAYHIGQRALGMAAADPDSLGQAYFAVAGGALMLGRPAQAIEDFDRCAEHSQDGFSFILGTRLEVHALAWASHAHWLTGDDAGATARNDEALARARASGHPYTLALALGFAGMLCQFRGDKDTLGPLVAELVEICDRYDLAYYGQWALMLQGWRAGNAAGTEQIRRALHTLQSQAALARMPYWLDLLAENLIAGGQRDQARGVLDSAIAAAEHHHDRWWLPEVMRRRAGLEAADAGGLMLEQARQLAIAQDSPALLARFDSA